MILLQTHTVTPLTLFLHFLVISSIKVMKINGLSNSILPDFLICGKFIRANIVYSHYVTDVHLYTSDRLKLSPVFSSMG